MYRITTVGRLDGKPTTLQFRRYYGKKGALETYLAIITPPNRGFYDFAAIYELCDKGDVDTLLSSYVASRAIDMAGRPPSARVKGAVG